MNILQFRRATGEDFSAVYQQYMHPSINPYLAFDLATEEAFYTIYQKLLGDGELVIVLHEERIVGSYHLFNKQYRQADTVYLATLVITASEAGRGFGAITLRHIIDSMTSLGKNRIELEVSVNNAKAIRLYQKAGFVIEGTIRQSYRIAPFAAYHDDYLMALLLLEQKQ